jgi:hypothetical protein
MKAEIIRAELLQNEGLGVLIIEVLAQAGRIGTHIGDQADMLAIDVHAFVEALGDRLGLAGRELKRL